MANISIKDFQNITVDGKQAGHILDAHANIPGIHADLKAAFDVWILNFLAIHAAEVASLGEDIAALGTKEEAAAIREAQAAEARAKRAAELRAELAQLEEESK